MAVTRSQKLAPNEKDPGKIVRSLNLVIDGRTDNYGQVTLTANAASTTFEHAALSENSTIALTPRTAHAAAAMAAGTLYVSAKANGSVTFAHANNAQTDRTFDLAWIG